MARKAGNVSRIHEVRGMLITVTTHCREGRKHVTKVSEKESRMTPCLSVKERKRGKISFGELEYGTSTSYKRICALYVKTNTFFAQSDWEARDGGLQWQSLSRRGNREGGNKRISLNAA